MLLPQARLAIENLALRQQLAVYKQAAQVASTRPRLLGLVVSSLAPLAIGAGHCSTGDSHPLASPGIQAVLALEIPKSFCPFVPFVP